MLSGWLSRISSGPDLAGLANVQRQRIDRVMADIECTALTPDIDTTQVGAEKVMAHPTYQSENSYMPMGDHLAETGLMIGTPLATARTPGVAQAGIHSNL